jgi:hypothetical protein
VAAKLLRWFHAAATVAWVLLAVPTMLWWRNSVPWIGFMSVYAIVVSHAGAWQASRAERAAQSTPEP